MQTPDDFNGFVDIDNKNIPFSFSKKDYRLKIYPDYDTWSEHYMDPEYFFPLLKHNPKVHKDPEFILLRGMTSSSQTVIFNVSDQPSFYSGFESYGVRWFYCSRFANDKVTVFNGLRISGRAVNAFFNPNRVFKNDVNIDDDTLQEMSVKASSSNSEDCGKFKFKDVETSLRIQAFPTLHFKGTNPFSSESFLYMDFSDNLDVDDIAQLSYLTNKVFQLLSYRRNIQLNDVEVRRKNSDGKYDIYGAINLHLDTYPAETGEIERFTIPYSDLKCHLSGIFDGINCKKISVSAISDTFDKRNEYTSARIYMVLADYDRMFNSQLRGNIKRSKTFKESRDEIISFLKEQATSLDDNKRSDYSRIINSVSHIGNDVSFEKKLKIGLKAGKPVMKSFIDRKYTGQYSKVTDGISGRIGTLRNKIAHGSLDFDIKQEHLCDIQMIEIYIYALILMFAGVKDNSKITDALNSLFVIGTF